MADKLSIVVLGSGSKGNATVIHDGNEAILVDAGLSTKAICERLNEVGLEPEMLKAVLITHEHSDHVKGLATLTKRFSIPIYTASMTARAIYEKNNQLRQIKVFSPGAGFRIANFAVKSFSISHDAVDPVGFTIQNSCGKIGVATDLGIATELVKTQLKDCDVMYVESNHDIDMLWQSERPAILKQRIYGNRGHLSNPACMQMLHEIVNEQTRSIILGHISQDCNCYQLVQTKLKECLQQLNRNDIGMSIATQDQAIKPITL